MPIAEIISMNYFQNEIIINFLIYNNFVDANLEGANLECINHEICKQWFMKIRQQQNYQD